MRLLNTASLQLKFFIGSATPPYVILSHTWEEDEVLFVDVQKGGSAVTSKKSFAKVKGCCDKAVADGFEWVWIDTCCIDKSSSAELSEAINSMYAWYQKSTICYAYLQDVSAFVTSGSAPSSSEVSAKFSINDLAKSRWFTRGWTLQKLIAPSIVEFYTSEWVEIGTRGSFPKQLFEITGVPVKVLCGEDPSTFSVAERMSWASNRQTTRDEDMAYCLLGLFHVNMPLLYGEGQKSFYRLQEQILNQEEDYSILAWSLQYDCRQSLTGLLATSPKEFSKAVPLQLQTPTMDFLNMASFEIIETTTSGGGFAKAPAEQAHQRTSSKPHLQLTNGQRLSLERNEYDLLWDKAYDRLSMFSFKQRSWFLHLAAKAAPTNISSITHMPSEPPALMSRGLRISLPVLTSPDSRAPLVAWLYCELQGRLLCILLRDSQGSGLYGRCASPWLLTVRYSLKERFTVQTLYMHPSGVIQDHSQKHQLSSPSLGKAGVVKVNLIESKYFGRPRVIAPYPPKSWSAGKFTFHDEPMIIGTILVEFAENLRASQVVVAVGIQKGQPWCEVRQWTYHASSLSTFFDEFAYQAEGTVKSLNKTDRRAIICDERFFILAAIRKSPAADGISAAFTLQVQARQISDPAAWHSFNSPAQNEGNGTVHRAVG